jgi:hypothetical protein
LGHGRSELLSRGMDSRQQRDALCCGLQVLAGGTGFVAGTAVSHVGLGVLRVSAATPLIATVAGCTTVALSSVGAACCASIAKKVGVQRRSPCTDMAAPSTQMFYHTQPMDLGACAGMVSDGVSAVSVGRASLSWAAAGSCAFLLLGGRFRSIGPSDYRSTILCMPFTSLTVRDPQVSRCVRKPQGLDSSKGGRVC